MSFIQSIDQIKMYYSHLKLNQTPVPLNVFSMMMRFRLTYEEAYCIGFLRRKSITSAAKLQSPLPPPHHSH